MIKFLATVRGVKRVLLGILSVLLGFVFFFLTAEGMVAGEITGEITGNETLFWFSVIGGSLATALFFTCATALSQKRYDPNAPRVMTDSERLATVINLLNKMPIQAAGSSEEPWVTLASIELTTIVNVAEGKDDPATWVSVPCKHATGIGLKPGDTPFTFDHSPHHWSEIIGSITDAHVTRVPHYCDGVKLANRRTE